MRESPFTLNQDADATASFLGKSQSVPDVAVNSTRVAIRRIAGMTLVETIVIMVIVGLLGILLLPALQYAREATRRNSCANNLRQIGLSMYLHESAQTHFPTGGWSEAWVGDPDAGFSEKQPGSWIFNSLGYMEQDSVRSIAIGKSGEQKKAALTEMMAKPVAAFNCPSRRLPKAYPYYGQTLLNANFPDEVAKSDYVANSAVCPQKGVTRRTELSQSLARYSQGLSRIVFAGEKSLSPSEYETGNEGGDRLSMYVGFALDTVREVGTPSHDSESAGHPNALWRWLSQIDIYGHSRSIAVYSADP
jgi:type II secretory pathway pseudopilin PulG